MNVLIDQDDYLIKFQLRKVTEYWGITNQDKDIGIDEFSSQKKSSRSGAGLVIKDITATGGGGAAPEGSLGGIPGLRELLDLEDLQFTQGSHFMANKLKFIQSDKNSFLNAKYCTKLNFI